MKEILEIHGFAEGATDSPKMILKTAYKAGMIKDEELWLSALQERNNVTHSYNRKIAMGIITQAKQKFYKMFCELKEEIDIFMTSLSKSHRQIFILRYWYFMPVKEIAKCTNMSISKVESILFRTRKKLKKQLTERKYL